MPEMFVKLFYRLKNLKVYAVDRKGKAELRLLSLSIYFLKTRLLRYIGWCIFFTNKLT